MKSCPDKIIGSPVKFFHYKLNRIYAIDKKNKKIIRICIYLINIPIFWIIVGSVKFSFCKSLAKYSGNYISSQEKIGFGSYCNFYP
jgi:hypothetical protein